MGCTSSLRFGRFKLSSVAISVVTWTCLSTLLSADQSIGQKLMGKIGRRDIDNKLGAGTDQTTEFGILFVVIAITHPQNNAAFFIVKAKQITVN